MLSCISRLDGAGGLGFRKRGKVNRAIATPTAKVNNATRTAKVFFFIATSQWLAVMVDQTKNDASRFSCAALISYLLDARGVKKFRPEMR